MSNATFYINESDYRKITKSLQQIGTVQDVKFKDDTELVNPTISIRNPVDSNNVETRLDIDSNYVYLEQTGRYYYINDVTYSQGRIYMRLKCDVLMSFQKAILAQPAILKRNANLKNAYLQDDKFNVYEFTNVRTVGFPENMGFSKNKQEFILAVVGSTSSI